MELFHAWPEVIVLQSCLLCQLFQLGMFNISPYVKYSLLNN
jgi:hypothetical protein